MNAPTTAAMARSVRRRFLLLFLAALMPGGAASGAFVLFEDFEDETPGPISGQDGWYAGGGDNAVIADPGAPVNQVLRVPSSSSILRKSLLADNLAVADGTVRMMFLRLRIGNKQSFSLGLSPYSSPSEYSDFAPEIGMANSAPNLDLRVWDDDGGNYEMLTSLQADQWFGLWVRIDAAANVCGLWLHDRAGQNALASDRLAAADGDESFEFRSGSTADLATFYIKTSGGSSGVNLGPLYIDDIYLETTSALNLTNPTAAVHLPGDANGDGSVDIADFVILKQNYGMTLDATAAQGDFNGDGAVDIQDFVILKQNYGT